VQVVGSELGAEFIFVSCFCCTFLTAGHLSEDGGFWILYLGFRILDFGLLIFGLLILDQNFIRRQPLQGDSRAIPQMRESRR
jgi:hypothetical protein